MVRYCLIFSLILAGCADKTAQNRSLSSEEDPWTTWSQTKGQIGGLLVLKNIRDNMLENNLHDPYVDYGKREVDCGKFEKKYRSFDGTCNNLDKPLVGSANTAFGRNIPPALINIESKESLMTPQPRLISQEFFTRSGKRTDYEKVPFLNMLAASWIQFMNHDWLTHGENARKNPFRLKAKGKSDLMVERTQKDTTDPSQYASEYQKTTLNKVTHWWDASQIYGSDEESQRKLRHSSFDSPSTANINYKELNHGKMRLEKGLLPKRTDLNPRNNRQNQGYALTGFSDNWWVGLSMLHHLFVKEHNAIVANLTKKYVRWDTKEQKWRWDKDGRFKKASGFFERLLGAGKDKFLTHAELDEKLFQLGRLINAAVLAKIHTIEWTPAILDNKTLRRAMFVNWYGAVNPQTWTSVLKDIPFLNKTDWFPIRSDYVIGGIVGDRTKDYGVPFSITEEFTSVYRLHSLLPETLELKRLVKNKRNKIIAVRKAEDMEFEDSRNEKSYKVMQEYPLSDLFYSFGQQLPGQLILNNFPRFMQELEIPGLGKMDLGAVDILRDRERGVPRYNQFRRAIGLNPIKSYRDFFPSDKPLDQRQKKLIAKFNKVYGQDADGNDNVEMIDLLVGSLAEEVRPKGFGFGETPFQIFILMASRRLMADRFFTEDYNAKTYTKLGIDWIDREGYLHKVIGRHMPELKPKMKGLKTAFAPWKK